jgi:hypothetical protein
VLVGGVLRLDGLDDLLSALVDRVHDVVVIALVDRLVDLLRGVLDGGVDLVQVPVVDDGDDRR